MADQNPSTDAHHQNATDRTSSALRGSTGKNVVDVDKATSPVTSADEVVKDVEKDGSGPEATPGPPKRKKREIALLMTAIGVSRHSPKTLTEWEAYKSLQ